MTSSKCWVEPSPEGEAGLTALPEADATGTRAEEEEARECPAAEVSGGQDRSVSNEEVTAPDEGPEEATQRSSGGRRSAEEEGDRSSDGGPGVCGERWAVS